jgi:hypothetical protein
VFLLSDYLLHERGGTFRAFPILGVRRFSSIFMNASKHLRSLT